MSDALRVGTRGSALALAQTRLVCEALEARGQACRPVLVETAGDRRAPDTAWGEGAFVAAIEEALVDGRVDIAVHSAKDVPTREDPRLRIAAFLERADPHDALVIRAHLAATRLEDLPPGSRVGTDSPRRSGFLRAVRPDLVMRPIHGNVDTRLRRLDEGEAEALVLAVAGLERLGRAGRVSQRLEAGTCPPAPGQGAIAIQVRADDERTLAAVVAVDDLATRAAVELERELLRAMGGGCRSPIGALAEPDGDGYRLLGGVAAIDGSRVRIERVRARAGFRAAAVDRLARQLGRSDPAGPDRARPGAGSEGARPGRAGSGSTGAHEPRPRVLVTRPEGRADDLVVALARLGIVGVPIPAIAIEAPLADGALDAALEEPEPWDRIVVTSPAGAAAVLAAFGRLGRDPRTARWAVVGAATGRLVSESGAADVWAPRVTGGAALAAELPVRPGERVLLAQGDLAGAAVAKGLRSRGALVREVTAYRTREAPPGSAALLAEILAADAVTAGPLAAVLLASGSAARGILALAGARAPDVAGLPAVCLGPETAAEAERLGFTVAGVAPRQTPAALAELTAAVLARSEDGIPA